MMNNWDNDFILLEICENIICLEKSNYYKHKGYTTKLQVGNYKNDLYVVQDKDFVNSHENFLTSFVYIDINGEC